MFRSLTTTEHCKLFCDTLKVSIGSNVFIFQVSVQVIVFLPVHSCSSYAIQSESEPPLTLKDNLNFNNFNELQNICNKINCIRSSVYEEKKIKTILTLCFILSRVTFGMLCWKYVHSEVIIVARDIRM